MTQDPDNPRRSAAIEAYRDETFLKSREARSLRILSEYLEPKSRFEHFQIEDTIVFMGSARVLSSEKAEKEVQAAEQGEGDMERAQQALDMSRYYEAARELARRLTHILPNLVVRRFRAAPIAT